MKFRVVVVALGILTFCCSFGLAVDCNNKYSVQNEVRQCFTKQGLQPHADAAQFQQAIHNDMEKLCQNKEAYALAIECGLSIAQNCEERAGKNADILPDPHKMGQGIKYLCDNKDDIDAQCIKDQRVAIHQCATNKAMAYFSDKSDVDATTIMCKSFEITLECAENQLRSCPGETKNVFVYYTQHYMTPPACKIDAQPDPGYRFTTVAPMTAVELVTGVPMLPDISCYSQSSIQDSQQKCFDREGIVVELPDIDLGGGRQAAKKSYLDAVMSNSQDFHAVCRQLPKYQRAMGCAMEVARHCMPAGYKDYLPDARKIQLMLGELCRHVDDINQKCVTSKASALYDCGYRKGMEHRTTDVKALLCNAFKFNTQCQKEVLPPCGCKTTRLYVDIAKKYLNPPACTPNYDTVPGCVPGSDAFAYTGVATQSAASAGLLAITGVLASLFFL